MRGYPRQSHNQWQPESPDWRTERDPPAKASGMNALPLIANLRLCSSRAGTSREPSSALAKRVFPVAEAESLARLLPGWHQASQTRQRWSSPLFRFDMADWAASTVSPPAGNAFICTAALELLLDLVEHRKRVLEPAAQAAAARSNLCTASRACCSRCIERRRSSGFSVAFARMKQHAASARVKAIAVVWAKPHLLAPGAAFSCWPCALQVQARSYRGGSKACAKNQGGKQRSACTRTTVLTGPCCVPQGETPLGTGHPPSSRPAGERRTCFVTICLLHCPTNGT